MTRLVPPVLLAALLVAPWASAQTPAPAAAPVGDANRGAQKVSMCQGCHGIPGWRTAFPEVYRVPKLSGQSAPYIVAALKQYKSGDRGHPTMKAIAGSLSEGDMADIAAYYTQTPLTTAAQ
ncbi:MAG: c-type cytochrome [Burkholderiales bacterium]